MSNQPNNNATSATENSQEDINNTIDQPATNENTSSASSTGTPVIANGGMCTCTGARDPSAQVGIAALSQSRVPVNGGSLLAATTNDKTVASVNFGTCKITRSACNANIQWQNAYVDTQILGSLEILTMNSTGMCSIGGKVEFATCGQSERVTPITTNDIQGLQTQQISEENATVSSGQILSEVSSYPNFNPLENIENTVLDLLKDPVIEVLEAGVGDSNPIEAITAVTYPQSKLGGTVKQPKNVPCTFKGSSSGTYHWKVRDESMSVLKEADGAGQITIRFPKQGRYVIEAYRTTSSSWVEDGTTIEQIDTQSSTFKNALIVKVVENELILKANKIKCIRGGSITIAVEKLFNTQDLDAGQISYQVLSQGLPLADNTQAEVTGNSQTATAKFNKEGSYVIHGTSSRGIKINPTDSIEVKNLSVKEVTAKGEKQYKARKGENIELKAVLESNDTPENQQKVKWEVYYSETENGNKTKCYPLAGGALIGNKPPVSLFTQTGFYFVYAFCATEKTESVKAVVEICQPKFVSTVWKDLNGNNIQEVGKREAVYANINMEGVSGLNLKFEVYCLQTNKLIENMSVTQMQFNKAIYKLKLSENAIKELQEGNKIYIKPVSKDTNITIVNKDKAPSDYPITYTTKKSIISINIYSDKDCKQILSVGTIGKTIYARVLTRNLGEPNLNLGIFRKLDASFNVSDIILFINNQPIKEDGSVVFEIVTKKGWQTTSKDNYLVFAAETKDSTPEYSALLEVFSSNRASAQLKINQNISFLTLTNNSTNAVGQNKTITTVNQVNYKTTKLWKCPNCEKDITLDQIKRICVDSKGKCLITDDSKIKEALPYLNKYREKVNLNTCSRKAHFLAQIAAETKYFKLQEIFDWYWEPLITTFSNYFNQFKTQEAKEKEAKRLGRLEKDGPSLTHEQQVKLANAIYGPTHKYGKNHTDPGDGWRYSGKGFKQVTWKDNYKNIETYYNKWVKDNADPDIKWTDGDNPFKLTQPKDAMLSALAFWGLKKIAYNAEKCEEKNLLEVSKKMTESTAKKIIDPRREFLNIAKKVLEVDLCKKTTSTLEVMNTTYDKKYKAETDDVVYIDVITEKNRQWEALMVVFDKTGILFRTYALCKGTNNDRFKAGGNGDTPTGLCKTSYDARHIGALAYGQHGVIDLIGIDGEFKKANEKGRAGLLIHCGRGFDIKTNKSATDFNDEGRRLLNTHGCIRIYNDEMKKLVNLYKDLKAQKKTIYCYIEDYDGKIEDVFDYYGFDLDIKDTERRISSKRQ